MKSLWISLLLTVLGAIGMPSHAQTLFNTPQEMPALTASQSQMLYEQKDLWSMSEDTLMAILLYGHNMVRKQHGLSPLTYSATITKVEMAFAQEEKPEELTHYDKAGQRFGQRLRKSLTGTNYVYRASGENLAQGDFTTVQELIEAWMTSAGHKTNILTDYYKSIGFGIDRKQKYIAIGFGWLEPATTAGESN